MLIKVENIEHLKKGLQSITAAVWKNEDQSDLQWVNLAVFENGICKTKLIYQIMNQCKENIMFIFIL